MLRVTRFMFWLGASLFIVAAPRVHAEKTLETPLKVIGIEKRTDIKVAYDIKDDIWDAGIGKGLFYVRGLLEAYKSMNVSPSQLRISVVLHGPTAYWLVNDDAFQRYKNDEFAYNPNTQVVEELQQHGVSVEICGVTMRSAGFSQAELLPGVKVVNDAYTRLIDLQQRGFAYIRY